jgi:hypothetical protein
VADRENRVLRRALGCSKEDEATGGWRKLHEEELYHLYGTPDTTKKLFHYTTGRRMGGDEV